jgi:Sulfotransferase family
VPIRRSVFVVSPPRTGGTLLFQLLARSPAAWTLPAECGDEIEGIPGLHPRDRGWSSNRLTGEDASGRVVAAVHRRLLAGLSDRDGRRPGPGEEVTLVEKTPKNALRVPFLAAAFPDASFVYLHRRPVETMASMLEGWWSQEFVTYGHLPGWPRLPWSFLLVPGWRRLADRSLAEVVAAQWAGTVGTLLDDLEALDPDRWCPCRLDDLVADPQAEVERLCARLGLAWDTRIAGPLPPSRSTLTPPAPDKWRRVAADLEPVLPLVAAVAARSEAVLP